MVTLSDLASFGEIAAEDDPVLDYFLTTDSVQRIESGKILLVLGRKGSGKTALVRHFTENNLREHGKPLSLRSYPWGAHAQLVDKGASETEAYVASWRLLISIRVASTVVRLGRSKYTDKLQGLSRFLMENFGTTDPETKMILARPKLKVVGLSIGPQIAGVSLGSITFGDPSRERVLGLELDTLATSILRDVSDVVAELGIKRLFLHFNELDQGLDQLDDTRKRMLIGLILAVRVISGSNNLRANISPIIYLRSDIWEQIQFSDKNKITRTVTVPLHWDERSLKALVENRLKARLGSEVSWDQIEDGEKMRGSQLKLNHVFARTFLRPRDVIQFLNEALIIAKNRGGDPLVFQNSDLNDCREDYSVYLRDEMNDEIQPHWKKWTEALTALSKVGTITFRRDQFVEAYNQVKTKDNTMDADAALDALYRFSVIGYLSPSSGGGSAWTFRYSDTKSEWDATATRLKVHLGLKEQLKLKEQRN
ncbi:P-loop ATPase, Sll1717 family [Rhodophyticola porphyridii]|uniref:P-loop ATPase, Sll1717 family n=1 Tax=Rhodophyticola porphyridii TaxID=1852017 RepID=UPI0035CF4E3C